jgi:hypothetical protein
MNTIFTSRDGRNFADPYSRDRYEATLTEQSKHFNSGKPVARDLSAPSPWAQATHSFSIGGDPDTRSLADHYKRPGETAEQAADRLGEVAGRFEVKGGRATAVVNSAGQKFFGGGQ